MLSSVSGTIRTDLIGEAGTEAEEAHAAIRGARQHSERVASGRTPHVPSPHRNGGVP